MIYQLWMIRQTPATEQASFKLSDAEKKEVDQKLFDAHNAANASVLLICESGWANEEFDHWGITIFPNIEARSKLYHQMEESGLMRYIQAVSMLGTTMQEPTTVAFEHPVYVLSRWRNDAAATIARRGLSQAELAQLWINQRASFEKNGGCSVIQCNPYWANEHYWGFDAAAFPSLESLRDYKADLLNIDWPLYYPAESILGLPSQM